MDKKVHDLVVVGAGPASLTTAIYTSREDVETLLVEKLTVGGLMASTDKIDNYPGFPDGITGSELAGLMEEQAKKFGTIIEFGTVNSIKDLGSEKLIIADGNEIYARSVLIATGSDNNRLNIPGEDDYYGRGVHFCATCDGAFYRDKNIIVVGGGNSAFQESIYLTRFASHIDIVVRSQIRASEALQKDIQRYIDDGKIAIHIGYTTEEISAENNRVAGVVLAKNGQKVSLKGDGVFIFAGLKPNTAFLQGSGIELDELGFIKTDSKMRTNLRGIFACGDVRSGATMQIATAVGEGALVAYAIRDYLLELPR